MTEDMHYEIRRYWKRGPVMGYEILAVAETAAEAERIEEEHHHELIAAGNAGDPRGMETTMTTVHPVH